MLHDRRKEINKILYTVFLSRRILSNSGTMLDIDNQLGHTSNTSDHMNIRQSTLTTGYVCSQYSVGKCIHVL